MRIYPYVCFVVRNLMAKEDWKKLGYADAQESRTAVEK